MSRGAAGPARDPGPADREGAALGAQPGRNGAERSGARRGDETPNRTPTAFWVHAARRQNSCSSATREATPANPGRAGQPIALARSPPDQQGGGDGGGCHAQDCRVKPAQREQCEVT